MSFLDLPDNLPIPIDDGASDHLLGLRIPPIDLKATSGEMVSLDNISGRYIIYIYPRTGLPGRTSPEGWDKIPGARGCTPQSCAFRDHYAELRELHTGVFGLSVQDTPSQQEAKERLHLPFELLSDDGLALKKALMLQTFEVEELELYKRTTLIIQDGEIIKVFYPVFPPNENAQEVIGWLTENNTQ